MTTVLTSLGRRELALALACVDQLTSGRLDLGVDVLEDEFVTHVERAARTLPPEDTDTFWDNLQRWLDQLA